MKTYYLSSLDYFDFERIRKCKFVKRMTLETGLECVLVKLKPPVAGKDFGLVDDLEYFILINRHMGEHLFPITSFPCSVHIGRLLSDDVMNKDTILSSEFKTVGWGELYKSFFGALISILR